MRVLSGIQPSGKLHLGNYFGALRQYLALQDEEALFFIADLHALTTVRDAALLRELSRSAALDYLALGLDPQRCTIFVQSEVSLHAELAWILSTLTPMGLLERAHSYKDKLAHGRPADCGLFTYPVLMAADILLYGADQVPVGQDQRQHLEIARDICTKFNIAFVPGFVPKDPHGANGGPAGILKLPEPYILNATAQVPGTDGQKMSKSYNNTLELFGDVAVLRKRIMGIKTDSTPVEAPKPAGTPLWALLELFVDPTERQSLLKSWEAGGVGYGTYKKRLAELTLDYFSAARARRATLEADSGYVDDVLDQGAQRAKALAAPIWSEVQRAVGIGPRRSKRYELAPS
jgi:tryptophanyl-tRNA synthetase